MWCPRRPYLAGLPAPGRHQLPARFRTLETERKGRGRGRGGGLGWAGAKTGESDSGAITLTELGLTQLLGLRGPLQVKSESVEGPRDPAFLGLQGRRGKGGHLGSQLKGALWVLVPLKLITGSLWTSLP